MPTKPTVLLVFACLLAWPAAIAFASPPRVIAVSPVDGARYVRPGSSILVRYDRDAGLAGAKLDGLVTVTGDVSGPHTGRTHLTRDGSGLLFDPDVPFTLGESVAVSVSPAGAADPGRLGASRSFTFRVASRLPAATRPPSDFSLGPIGYSARPVPAWPSPAGGAIVERPADLPADFPTVVLADSGGTSPGYLFLSNMPITHSATPYLMILDDAGTPVWYQAMGSYCTDFKRQPNGKITYFDGPRQCFAELDSLMQPVRDWACVGGYTTDVHELQLLDDGHALLMSYDPQVVDMSAVVAGGDTAATVWGLVIQELDAQGDLVFQWRSWDHFDITDAIGQDLTAPEVDYVHGNALEVDGDGNLLLSSRHLCEITKIDRGTGDVLWRWGGLRNQFEFVGDTLQFSFQHAIRRLPDGHYTLFDNGNLHAPVPFSRACEYVLDQQNLTATLVWSWRNDPDTYGFAMGYMQREADGSSLVGWGMGKPDVTEVGPDGRVRMHLWLPEGESSYRAYRCAWTPFVPQLDVDGSGREGLDLALLGPNPVRGATTMLARVPRAGAVDVAVFDVQGRQVATPVPRRETAAGVLTVPLAFAGLPDGVYLVRLRTPAGERTRRVLLAR